MTTDKQPESQPEPSEREIDQQLKDYYYDHEALADEPV
jgi:hypothetical protein